MCGSERIGENALGWLELRVRFLNRPLLSDDKNTGNDRNILDPAADAVYFFLVSVAERGVLLRRKFVVSERIIILCQLEFPGIFPHLGEGHATLDDGAMSHRPYTSRHQYLKGQEYQLFGKITDEQIERLVIVRHVFFSGNKCSQSRRPVDKLLGFNYQEDPS